MEGYERASLHGAEWISTGGKCDTPLFRGTVTLPKIIKATITIAGLGTYELYLNGKRVSEDLFLPLSTDYVERSHMMYGEKPFREKLRHRLYCPVYNVTSWLKEGINSVCFLMGPGWYGLPEYGFGPVGLCFSLEYTDEQGKTRFTGSNSQFKWTRGFVKQSNLLYGETHDYTGYDDSWMEAGFNDRDWEGVMVEKAPDTNLYIQDCPADRVIRHVTPRLIARYGQVSLYDAGEIISGYPVFRSGVPAGEVIAVRYGELLEQREKMRKDEPGIHTSEQGLNTRENELPEPEYRLDEEHIYGQYTDFVTDGSPRKMHCKFTWLCFRYFEVTGDAEVTDCVVIHGDLDVTSDFSCSSDVLNWIRDAYIRTQLANMHGGIPSDCPHAERRGYTGDGQLTCRAAMLQLDARKFYRKWICDIADCQDSETGHVQYTAPFLPSGGGPGGWGCAIVMVPYAWYRNYGDPEVLRELYPQMLKWFEYMEAHSEGELVVSDRESVWCLGDWCAPDMTFNQLEAMKIPAPLVNTYFYIKAMEIVIKINALLGRNDNTPMLQSRIARKKEAVTERYFEPDTGNFAGNQQGSNVFALDLGLGDERTFRHMTDHYRRLGRYDTGIFGTDILTGYLFEHGEEELAVALLTSEDEYSFYHQMKTGGTTIAEYWSGFRSQCHPMFGAVSAYLFEYVLGIRQEEESVCFRRTVIEPRCMHLIPEAEGHIVTASGKISVSYDREYVRVSVPEKTEAVLKAGGRSYILSPGKETCVKRLQEVK